MRHIVGLAGLGVVMLTLGCRETPPAPVEPTASESAAGEASMSDQAEAVRRELRALMERPGDPLEGMPFLIITARGTDKFVQFSGGAGEDLVFDLPLVALSDDEAERARQILPAHGVSVPAESDPDGVDALSANLGGDIEAAVGLVGVVLVEVYGLDPAVGLEFQGL